MATPAVAFAGGGCAMASLFAAAAMILKLALLVASVAVASPTASCFRPARLILRFGKCAMPLASVLVACIPVSDPAPSVRERVSRTLATGVALVQAAT